MACGGPDTRGEMCDLSVAVSAVICIGTAHIAYDVLGEEITNCQ